MAIYHLSAKIISRKAGRSSTAAAAYRAGEKIVDERTGEIHDYGKKRGIDHAELVMPSGTDWRPTRAELWNVVEAKNKRADAQVAREFVIALPDEISPAQRQRLALDFAREIADRYGVAADVAIHRPDRSGDQRNHHAHILTSTNRVEDRGFGNKARELDLVAHNMGGNVGQANAIDHLRERWADLANAALERAGQAARIDHRSHADAGIEAEPGQHLGPQIVNMERRQQRRSRVRAERERGQVERQRLDQVERAHLVEAEADEQRAAIQLEALLADQRREREQKAKPAPVIDAGRVQALHKLAANAVGAAATLGERGVAALERAGGNPAAVDWRQVEAEALREAMAENGQEAPDVARALAQHSPLRADPASHAEIRAQIEREGPALSAAYERRREGGYDYDE